MPSPADFALMAEHLPEPAWVANARGRLIWGNKRWREYIGITQDEVGDTNWETIHDPATLPEVTERWKHALKTGEPTEMAFPLRGADGVFRMFMTRARPLRDEAGKVTFWFGINTDVSEREAEAAELANQKRLLEALNRTAANVAAELNLERLVQMVTDVAVELTGAKFGAFFYHIPQDDGEVMTLYTISGVPREAFARFPMVRETDVFRTTFRGEGAVRSDDITRDPRYGKNAPYNGMPEGHLPVRSYLAVPVVSRRGEAMGSLLFGHPEAGRFTADHEAIVAGLAAQAAVGVDNARLYESAQNEIADRREAEEARLVVLRELNHRVKNLFAIAVGMVSMTARTSATTEAMANTLSGRLRALAHAHQLIRPNTASEDQRAKQTTVAAMIERILAPHITSDDSQVRIDGPEVPVGPNGATSLALVLHELATNTAKHGALSEAGGSVSISWRIEGTAMVMNWIERGGPAINGAPSRKGFGTELALMSAKGQLGGSITHAWHAAGVEIELRASIERLAT